MKANRLLVSFAVSAAFFSASAMAIDGIINFEGDIVATPCVVATKSQNQNVNLGQVKKIDLNGTAGLRSAGTPFDIVLEECSLDATNPEQAHISFIGNSVSPTVLAAGLQQGGATGVGIELSDVNGDVITLNQVHTTPFNLVDGQNTLKFSARYISTAATVTTGHADATADFQFQYK